MDAAGAIPNAATGEDGRRLGHVPQLDGLRGIAVLLTVGAHSELPGAVGGGSTGVTLFFVLSGFLITSLLAQEWGSSGRISLPQFYARRALRLVPALWLVIVVYLVLALVAFNPTTVLDRFGAAFYVATSFGNWQSATGGHLAELSHTWSLAVEDQFYLLWPIALLVALRAGRSRRAILAFTIGLAVALAALRGGSYVSGVPWHRIYFGTDMVGSALLIGCVAGLCYTWGIGPQRIPGARWIVLAGLGIVVAVTALSSQHTELGRGFLATVGFPTVALAAAATILVVAIERSTAGFLSHPVLRYFGRISYGLYLWHLFTIHALDKLAGMSVLEQSWWSVPIAIVIASLSYALVEQPFLRLKDRLPSRRGAERPTQPAIRVPGVASPS